MLPSLAAFVWLLVAAPAFSTPSARPENGAVLVANVQRSTQTTPGKAASLSGVPLEQLTDLNAGDQVTLQVVGASEQWVVVQGWEDPRWEIYFSGSTPPAGRLPMTLSIADAGETRLRLWVCAHEPVGGNFAGCNARVYAF